MKIQIEIICFPSRCILTHSLAFVGEAVIVDLRWMSPHYIPQSRRHNRRGEGTSSPLPFTTLRRSAPTRHARNRVDQLAVGNLAVAVEAQPLAFAPRRVKI